MLSAFCVLWGGGFGGTIRYVKFANNIFLYYLLRYMQKSENRAISRFSKMSHISFHERDAEVAYVLTLEIPPLKYEYDTGLESSN